MALRARVLSTFGRRATVVLTAGLVGVGLAAAPATASPARASTYDDPAGAVERHAPGKGGWHPYPKDPKVTVVVSGLDNPRQLALGPDGRIWVAQAGHGGSSCVGEGDEQTCFGTTGAVATVDPGRATVRTVVSGLPSAAGPDGSFAGGATGLAVPPRGPFRLAVNGAEIPDAPAAYSAFSSSLIGVNRNGPVKVADLLAFELANNPDGQVQFGPDGAPLDALSNPYAAASFRGGTLVADAGANDVLWVSPGGRVRLFAALPLVTSGPCATAENNTPDGSTGCDPVPTGVAVGPDGWVYVSGLVAETPGEGRVWKLDPWTGKVVRTWSGFDGPSGVAVGRDGSVYVSELFADADFSDPDANPADWGRVTKVDRWGHRTSVKVTLPAGLVVRGGTVYASAWSVAPASGLFGNPAWTGRLVAIRHL